ncbi:MAG TPA: phage protease [Terriglobia bacterium]|nr:phage protease [Terriglobia bacterium]
MHPLSVEKSSSPSTIHARVGSNSSTGVPPVFVPADGRASLAKHGQERGPEHQGRATSNGPRTTEHGRPSSARSSSLVTRHPSPAKEKGHLPPRLPTPNSLLPPFSPPRFVVTLNAPLGTDNELARIPIAITGKWVRDGSDFSITLADLEEIVRNFKERRNGEINVDYDHASEMPEVAAGGPVPSAGRIVELEKPQLLVTPHPPSCVGHPLPKGEGKDEKNKLRSPLPGQEGKDEKNKLRSPLPRGEGGEGSEPGEGSRWILYGNYDPTPRARQLIESGEYRYISPAISWAGRDKRTGKMTGTTLTSVALTNRPFLEELPQIRLSDPAYQLVDVGEVHVDTSLGQPGTEKEESGVRSQKSEGGGQRTTDNGRTSSSIANHQSQIANISGGPMKQVNLSVQDGKIKVTHPDFADEYFADPTELKQCLDELGGDSGEGETPEAALAAEIESLAGLERRADGAGAAAAATLSECVAEIRRRLEARREISLKEAGALLSENEAGGKSIAAADYFRARVDQELDEAVKNGKVLPRQREDWRKIALSDFPTFRKIVAEQKSQVPLRPVGLSGSGPEDAQTQVKLLAEQRMRERSISFGQALSEIGREQPELVHQYRRAVSA